MSAIPSSTATTWAQTQRDAAMYEYYTGKENNNWFERNISGPFTYHVLYKAVDRSSGPINRALDTKIELTSAVDGSDAEFMLKTVAGVALFTAALAGGAVLLGAATTTTTTTAVATSSITASAAAASAATTGRVASRFGVLPPILEPIAPALGFTELHGDPSIALGLEASKAAEKLQELSKATGMSAWELPDSMKPWYDPR